MLDVKFKDVYDLVVEYEKALWEMGVDINKQPPCSTANCVLNEAQIKLFDSYQQLLDTEFDFTNINFGEMLNRIQNCFRCISFDGEGIDVPSPLPTPVDIIEACSGDVLLTLDDIKRFRIYEYSRNELNVYIIESKQLENGGSSEFVPEDTEEKYIFEWNKTRESLVITYTHKNPSKTPPQGGFNIARIIAELWPEVVGKPYVDVDACRVLQITPNVSWKSGLEKIVDGKYNTYSELLSTSSKSIKIEAQFMITIS